MWFMQRLSNVLDPRRTITFISDRNKGLLTAVRTVFPTAYHSYCLFHLRLNLKDKLKGVSNKFREKMVKRLNACAYACNARLFHKKMTQLWREGGEDVQNFLRNLPNNKWTNAYFEGNRYGEMCSNASESFNSQIRGARELAVTNMVDFIRKKIMSTRFDRRTSCKKWKSELCPEKDDKLRANVEACKSWPVSVSHDGLVEVYSSRSVTVDIDRRRCTCGKWQQDGFPCPHSVAALINRNKNLISYIEPYFLVSYFSQSYAAAIGPVPTFDKPDFNEAAVVVRPPQSKKQPGRTKRKMIANKGENTRTVTCGRCHGQGHNKKTCKEAM